MRRRQREQPRRELPRPSPPLPAQGTRRRRHRRCVGPRSAPPPGAYAVPVGVLLCLPRVLTCADVSPASRWTSSR